MILQRKPRFLENTFVSKGNWEVARIGVSNFVKNIVFNIDQSPSLTELNMMPDFGLI